MRPHRDYDTVELDASGRAKCRLCKSKITKGSPRACIHSLHHSGRYWNKYYYHTECLKTKPQGIAIWKRAYLSPELLQREKAGSNLSRMDLLDLGAAKASDTSKKQKTVSERTLHERRELASKLRQLRKYLSRRLGFGEDVYMVFQNKTLDALVLDLPTNKKELLNVHGFAQKRADTLGPFILPIIREYKRQIQNNLNGASESSTVSKLEGPFPNLEGDDDEVVVVSHDTIEDVVNRLFKEAEERGEVISL